MYSYTVYGLTIRSEIECPELPSSTAQPDVQIQYGTIDSSVIPEEHPWTIFALGKNQILLNIKEVAKFLVSDGCKIKIDPYPKAEENTIRLFLLGSSFGAILHQRGILPIHGNGIVHNGECVIFAGRSGIGKSTLAAAFAQKGYEILTDDVCATHVFANEKPLVYPGFPQVKLWSDAAEQMNVPWQELKPVLPAENKYVLPIKENYHDTPVRLKQLIFLNFHEEINFQLQELDNLGAINPIRNNTYRLGMLKKMGKVNEHFSLCSRLAKEIRVARLSRPEDLSRLDEVIELVERYLSNEEKR